MGVGGCKAYKTSYMSVELGVICQVDVGPRYGGGRTNPYLDSLLDDCSHASKEPVYGLFRPNTCCGMLCKLYVPKRINKVLGVVCC
jgi:hypothetical protein